MERVKDLQGVEYYLNENEQTVTRITTYYYSYGTTSLQRITKPYVKENFGKPYINRPDELLSTV